jgi:hypothetical protein
MGGVVKVFHNLCLGLDRLGIEHLINLPCKELAAEDRVRALGRELAFMTRPTERPLLYENSPKNRILHRSA